jgi:hypothetical protein
MGLADESYMFTQGSGTMSIRGTWGWLASEFPEAVGQAILMDVEDQALTIRHQLREPLGAMQQLGLRRLSQGELSVERASNQSPSLSGLRQAPRRAVRGWRGRDAPPGVRRPFGPQSLAPFRVRNVAADRPARPSGLPRRGRGATSRRSRCQTPC